jgi:hypothetical protein
MARRALVPLVLIALVAMAAVAVAATAPSTKPVTKVDAKGDVNASPLDLTRFTLARGTDGRLRATLTVADTWDGNDLLSDTGPPGSLCVKAWTTTVPPDTTPDYLICVTAQKSGDLRASILQQRANKLPARTGTADLSRPNDRSVTLRFSQTALGKPATLYAAAETTRPGCPRGSCIDLAPDAPDTLSLKLRTTKTTPTA